MKYVAYKKYKSSGTEWLGNVPAHWEVSPLKYAASIKTGYAFSSDEFTDEGIPVLRISDITKEGMVDLSNAKYLPIENATAFGAVTLKKDDIVMAMTGATIGKAGRYESNKPCLLNQRVCAFKTTKDNYQTFLWYLLNADFFNKHIALTAFGGAQPNISDTQLLACDAPLPPLEEQQIIARFLDTKTAQIDDLIAKKRQLIDKLKEKRQALIARTVTRGLPREAAEAAGLETNPEMKNVEDGWIGEIPVHWKPMKGSHIGRLIGSLAPAEEDVTEDNDGVPYTKVDDLNFLDSSLLLTSTKMRLHCPPPRWNTIILFPKRGAAIFTNKVALAKRVTFDSNLMGWEVHKDSDPKFIAYCLIARRLDDLADVSTVPQINNKHIYPTKFPHPPKSEQEAIVAFLDNETTRIDQLTDNVEVAITRLIEYRQALITSAVTGKIDVRGLA